MRYDFDTPVDRRGTWCVQWDGVADRFAVPDLLPFTISDMDFACAPEVLAALGSRLAHGVFGYTDWRHDDFRGAVRDWFATRYGTEVDVDRLVYAPSVLNQISQLLRMWTRPGDGVVLHTPAYDGFRKAVTGLGREMRTAGVDDWAGLERELARPDSRVLILCSPHNPTGKVWTDAELTRIADLARRHDVAVISDEIHADLTHTGHVHRPWTPYGDGLRWALVTSATKAFNFPALSGSYGFIGDPDDHAEFVRRMDTAEGLASCGRAVADRAHRRVPGGRGVAGRRAGLHAGEPGDARGAARRRVPRARVAAAAGGYLAWIDLRPLGVDDDALQRELVERERVAIMPGGTYGAPGFLRLNVGCPRSKAEAGADALVRALGRS